MSYRQTCQVIWSSRLVRKVPGLRTKSRGVTSGGAAERPGKAAGGGWRLVRGGRVRMGAGLGGKETGRGEGRSSRPPLRGREADGARPRPSSSEPSPVFLL